MIISRLDSGVKFLIYFSLGSHDSSSYLLTHMFLGCIYLTPNQLNYIECLVNTLYILTASNIWLNLVRYMCFDICKRKRARLIERGRAGEINIKGFFYICALNKLLLIICYFITAAILNAFSKLYLISNTWG